MPSHVPEPHRVQCFFQELTLEHSISIRPRSKFLHTRSTLGLKTLVLPDSLSISSCRACRLTQHAEKTAQDTIFCVLNDNLIHKGKNKIIGYLQNFVRIIKKSHLILLHTRHENCDFSSGSLNEHFAVSDTFNLLTAGNSYTETANIDERQRNLYLT